MYDRLVYLFMAGEVDTAAFIRVFMAIWGVIDPGLRGKKSDVLHQVFAYLEDLDVFDPPPDRDAQRAVASMWLRAYPDQAQYFPGLADGNGDTEDD